MSAASPVPALMIGCFAEHGLLNNTSAAVPFTQKTRAILTQSQRRRQIGEMGNQAIAWLSCCVKLYYYIVFLSIFVVRDKAV